MTDPTLPPGYTSPAPPGAGGPPAAFAPPPFAPGTYVLSGWWRRVGAALIDGFIVLLVAVLVMAPLGAGIFAITGDDDPSGVGIGAVIAGFFVAMLIVAVVFLVYAPLMMSRTNGRTVGRMVTGIRVIRANGQPMTFGFAALREIVVKTLLINTVAGGVTGGIASLVDVLWPLWDDENRALHDMIVNTRTVRA